ncbi:unnamed protein product [Ambrosiozyma monospora]|uniref:Unnamed protein product n=1 Tax=Ambrosiozyma monospora TaxID=43982 RepID=A0A9W7DJY5_AMBMO|nr:unnamed protein product [Ambrosiozyma monospora]
MATNLRTWDRLLNKEFYPNLYYPDIVILDGGYKKYYEKYNGFSCYPLNYIEMHDPQYKAECERGLDKLRRDSKLNLNRKDSFHGLTRRSSQRTLSMKRSFTYGQTSLNFGAATTRTISTDARTGHAKSKSVSIFNLKNESFNYSASEQTSNDAGIFGTAATSTKNNSDRKIDLDQFFEDSPISQKTINFHDYSSSSIGSATGSVFSSCKKTVHSASSSVSSFEFAFPSSNSSESHPHLSKTMSATTATTSCVPPPLSFPEPFTANSQHSFKLPSLPTKRCSKSHMRSQTFSGFQFSSTSSPAGAPPTPVTSTSLFFSEDISNDSHAAHTNNNAYRSSFQRKLQKHIDTPITKKSSFSAL